MSRAMNVLSFIVGILGVVLSVYFYFETIEKRNPVLISEGNYNILSQQLVVIAPIKILKSNNDSIKGDIYFSKFYFFNNGKKSIRSSDVLQQIKFQFGSSDSNSEILSFNLIKSSRPDITRVELVQDITHPNMLNLNFNILEKGDGFSAQVIYSASCNCLNPLGVIEGVEKIEMGHGQKSKIPLFVSIVAIVIACGLWIVFFGKKSNDFSFRKKIIASIIIGILIGFFSSSLYLKSSEILIPIELIEDD